MNKIEFKIEHAVILILVGIIAFTNFGGFLAVTTDLPENQTLWWYDDNSLICEEKTFSGFYMYEGLEVFETREACDASLYDQPKFSWAGIIAGLIIMGLLIAKYKR